MAARWAAIALLFAVAACGPREAGPVASPAERLRERSDAFLAAIRERDMETAAEFVHPRRGVRLSPYAFVDVESDQLLDSQSFRAVWSGESPRLWGLEDATGDPLMMSAGDYLERFIYDVDFLAAEQTSVDAVIGRGNTINNAAEIYPDARIVEYHFPGLEPQYAGMDWRSLRLVFEPLDDEWYLVGIVHDQWTS